MEAALDGLAGILKIEVDLGRDAFTVTYDPSRVTPSEIQETIVGLGFRPRAADPEMPPGAREREPAAPVPQPIAGALSEARESGRLVFLDFYAEWCLPCKVLEEKTIPDPRVQQALADYVYLRVDTDKFPQAGKHYNVVAMPTVLLLDGEGEELWRQIGLITAQELAQQLQELTGTR